MDAKDTWPIVKFLIAATGLKTKDARLLLEEMSDQHYSQLFIKARSWDRDQAAKAAEELGSLVGADTMPTLLRAVKMAQRPVETGHPDDEPARKAVKKKKR